jgi:hypothetical protein
MHWKSNVVWSSVFCIHNELTLYGYEHFHRFIFPCAILTLLTPNVLWQDGCRSSSLAMILWTHYFASTNLKSWNCIFPPNTSYVLIFISFHCIFPPTNFFCLFIYVCLHLLLPLPLVNFDIDIIPKHIDIWVVEDSIEMGDMKGWLKKGLPTMKAWNQAWSGHKANHM